MIFLILLVLPLAASILLYLYLRRRNSDSAVWSSALKFGVGLGLVRSTLVCAGWWFVERTSGSLQIPGYFFVMIALPEALLLQRSAKVLSFGGYIILGGIVFLGAVAWVLLIGGVVVASRRL